MSFRKHFTKYLPVALCLVLSWVSTSPLAAADVVALFADSAETALELTAAEIAALDKLEARPTTVETRPVAVDGLDALAQAQPIVIELFAGEVVELDDARLMVREPNDFTYVGSDSADDADFAVLVVRKGRITGSVWRDGQLFRIRPLGGDRHAVIRVSTEAFPEEHPPMPGEEEPMLSTAASLPESSPGTTGESAQEANTVITVLVAYTNAVDNLLFDVIGEIQLAVDETNVSYDRSGVNIDLVLAHTMEVNYTESGSHDTDLTRFEDQADNHMDEIHLQRDLNAADVAVLFIDDGDVYCGLASRINATRSTAFATVHYDCATGNYSFGHEIGHLQAARHDTDSSNSPYAYGHGYYYAAGGWRTIMGVFRSGVTRIQNWSNPNVTYSGVATGTSASNDNARVLNNTKGTVAGFRPSISNNQSHEVNGIASCMGESYECEILTHENVTMTGTIVVSGGGYSGSWSQLGYRCGTSSTTHQYIEVYENDTNHDWTWPDHCLAIGSPFTLEAGKTYDFRGPSVVGADASTFTISSYTPPPLSVYITRAGSPQVMTAHASGGVPPYTSYAWYRMPVCSGGPAPVLSEPKKGGGQTEDVPCTEWYGPTYTSPPNQWTPYQGSNQNIKVVVTDSAGSTTTAYSWAN